MPQQQIIWTVLPNGVTPDGTTLLLSVVASPRLRLDDGGTGTLQSFPDFLDWPAHIAQTLTGFDLIVDDDEAHPIAATIVTPAPAQPTGSDIWKALFSADTSVRSQQFEGFQAPVASYSVSDVAAHLQSGYTSLAVDAPFRPADKATFKTNFANVTHAPTPTRTAGTTTMRARLPLAHTLSADELAGMHRELSDSLLHSEPGMSFDEKLAGLAHVAGALARAAPPGQPVPLVADSDHPANAFAQFAAFHRRPAAAARIATDSAPAPDNEIDFHRALTALGEYSWLLRRLGLIFDLTVAAALVPTSPIGALRQIRVRPRFSSPAADASTYAPATKYILDNDTTGPLPFHAFVAAPRAAQTPATPLTQLEIVGGFLNLGLTRPPPPPTDDPQFDIFNVDIDGAAKKILNTIQIIGNGGGAQPAPVDAGNEVAAPALQTSGLNLVRTGQANLLMNDVATAQGQDNDRLAGRRAVLFAEDLVRGYRIDVCHFLPGFQPHDPQPPWRSLHQRVADFHFKRNGAADLTVLGQEDEGSVQPVLVQDGNGTGNTLYIHESYAHWQGWSLSAPFPADPVGLTRGETPMPTAPAGLKQVDVSVRAKDRTLPRLRFGHSYQMRVRTVDLAGNGLTIPEAQARLETLHHFARPAVFIPIQGEQLPYRRFDPIASPVLVLREELMQGEADDVMVIRSNGPPTTTASYAAGLGDPRYHGFNDRHIVPPKTSQRMAERHGQFDRAFGADGPQSVFAMLGRDSGTLNDTSVINIRTGQPEALPDVPGTGPGGTPTTIPNGLKFIGADQGVSPGSGYTVHYEKQLRLPYLPDPLAEGAALFKLPGVKDNESRVLVESATPGTAGTLVSKKGDDQLLGPEALAALGPITKIGFPSAAQWPELRGFRLRLDGPDPNGDATPAWSEVKGVRKLTVRLLPAEVQTIFISTYPRKEDVPLFGLHFSVSRRLGSPEDERGFIEMAEHGALAMLTPARKVMLVHAVQQPLIAPQVDGTPFDAKRFVHGDTAAYIAGRFKINGASTEKLDLLASWIDPLQDSEEPASPIETHVLEVPIDLNVDPPNIQGDPVPVATFTKGPTEQPFPSVDHFQFNARTRGTDTRSFLARHEFGDTRHRHVTYTLVATTRFKEYFPESITQHQEKITRAATFEVDVPNSVRPPALEINSIVPAFQWDRSLDLTSSKRLGGWLRVYLGSKWFATGEGESLAIVGNPVAGADPLHATTSAQPATTILPQVTPVVVAGQNIYPFAVHHDDTAGLWYADLAFDVTGLYFPFVHLKLARFQQQSLDGVQPFSPVVDAGFYQLAPDRAVALTFFNVVPGQPDKHKIDMTLSGPGAAAAAMTSGVHLTYSVEVAIEERALGAPGDQRDPDLGWKPSTTIVPTVAPGPPAAGVLWHGSVIVPAVADMDRRIVFREFEIFPPNDPPPGQAWSGETAGAPRRRLVYAETIAVR